MELRSKKTVSRSSKRMLAASNGNGRSASRSNIPQASSQRRATAAPEPFRPSPARLPFADVSQSSSPFAAKTQQFDFSSADEQQSSNVFSNLFPDPYMGENAGHGLGDLDESEFPDMELYTIRTYTMRILDSALLRHQSALDEARYLQYQDMIGKLPAVTKILDEPTKSYKLKTVEIQTLQIFYIFKMTMQGGCLNIFGNNLSPQNPLLFRVDALDYGYCLLEKALWDTKTRQFKNIMVDYATQVYIAHFEAASSRPPATLHDKLFKPSHLYNVEDASKLSSEDEWYKANLRARSTKILQILKNRGVLRDEFPYKNFIDNVINYLVDTYKSQEKLPEIRSSSFLRASSVPRYSSPLRKESRYDSRPDFDGEEFEGFERRHSDRRRDLEEIDEEREEEIEVLNVEDEDEEAEEREEAETPLAKPTKGKQTAREPVDPYAPTTQDYEAMIGNARPFVEAQRSVSAKRKEPPTNADENVPKIRQRLSTRKVVRQDDEEEEEEDEDPPRPAPKKTAAPVSKPSSAKSTPRRTLKDLSDYDFSDSVSETRQPNAARKVASSQRQLSISPELASGRFASQSNENIMDVDDANPEADETFATANDEEEEEDPIHAEIDRDKIRRRAQEISRKLIAQVRGLQEKVSNQNSEDGEAVNDENEDPEEGSSRGNLAKRRNPTFEDIAAENNRRQNEVVVRRTAGNERRSARKRWSADELAALEEGMHLHSTHWNKIQADFGHRMPGRTQVDMKDKARNERNRRERNGQDLGIWGIQGLPRK
ncbi:hypothetical protein HDU97_005834 [Phlyctochytrium planicorne]|nr:hypothetical protein HDU97_005834 [Phlyctochytrium planicorne]